MASTVEMERRCLISHAVYAARDRTIDPVAVVRSVVGTTEEGCLHLQPVRCRAFWQAASMAGTMAH